jgi:hypothetical protein
VDSAFLPDRIDRQNRNIIRVLRQVKRDPLIGFAHVLIAVMDQLDQLFIGFRRAIRSHFSRPKLEGNKRASRIQSTTRSETCQTDCNAFFAALRHAYTPQQRMTRKSPPLTSAEA